MEVAIKTEDALQIPHIKLTRFFFWSIGIWPVENFDGKASWMYLLWRKTEHFKSLFCLFGQGFYLYKYGSKISYIDLGENVIVMLLTFESLIRYTSVYITGYGDVIWTFIKKFHLIHFQHHNDYAMKMYTSLNRLSIYFSMYSVSLMIIGAIFYNVPTIYRNTRAGAFSGHLKENATIVQNMNYMYPGFNPDEWIWTVTFINMSLSYECSVAICVVNLLLALMVFQIIGHCKLLMYNLTQFPLPKKSVSIQVTADANATVEMYDDEENIMIWGKLLEFIEHHKLIVNFTSDLSDVFGPLLAVNYMAHLVGCCLLLLECTQGEAGIIRFGPLAMNIFGELIQTSVLFEMVGTVSEKIDTAMYAVPWECMNGKNRRLVFFLINRLQSPIYVTALGVTPVGVTTMAAILRTTFSYFIFLRSLG